MSKVSALIAVAFAIAGLIWVRKFSDRKNLMTCVLGAVLIISLIILVESLVT